jgi:ABC-type phosphate transport system substrate-binding protein
MLKLSKAKAGIAALGAVGICAAAVGPATADIYPQTNDVVGGGSDTIQYTLDFIMDGTIGGFPGYNSNQPKNRVFSFDATADADGRGVYPANSTTLLPTTSVMRAGTKPVPRPNGSSAGIRALYQAPYIGTNGSPNVQFARSSRIPTCVENTAAQTAGYGGLHVYKFAADDLAMGTTPSTNAPAGLTPVQVLGIYTGQYTTWDQIPGNGGGSSATIIPLLPQSGSGTRSSFDADMKAANNGNTPTYSNPNIITTQESDWAQYDTVSGATNVNNRIGPFSSGRIGLNDSGYFGTDAQNKVVLRLGASPGGGNTYDNARTMVVVVRESDVNNAQVWQPGSTRNWVKTLFSGATSVLANPAYAGNIQAAGQTPVYQDLGVGVPGQSCS